MAEEGLIEKIKARRHGSYAHLAYSYWSKHYLLLITGAFLFCSIYFFVHIQLIRWNTLADHPQLFQSGDIVEITKVIDGDELQITNALGNSRIRILGIKSFDPSARDMMLSEYGKTCVDFLETHVVTRKAKLVISSKKLDDRGRLLGRLLIEEKTAGEEGQTARYDLGNELVRQGLSLVYTQYPFEEMPNYLSSQKSAEAEELGIWANQRVSKHAHNLQNLWTQEANKQ